MTGRDAISRKYRWTDMVKAMNAEVITLETPHSDSRSLLVGALARAQGAFGPIRRDKTVKVALKSGGSYTFSYAPLEAILRAVAEPLAANELALTQIVVRDEAREYVETTLWHSSGQSFSNRMAIFVKDDGPQAYGSALTYARRYSITLLLCVCADDDDDGNAAEGNEAQEKQTPRSQMQAKAREYAKRFIEARDIGLEQAVIDLAAEVNEAGEEFSREVWAYLPTATRREIKHILEQAKTQGGAVAAG